MTKTIEFIERQLIFTKEEERITKKQLEQIPPNEKLRINALKIKLQTIKNNLIQLEQIKCELEAWEICKNKLNLKVQTEEAVTEGFCMKGYWLLVEQYPYTQTTIIEQEEYEILKKALEVEDE